MSFTYELFDIDAARESLDPPNAALLAEIKHTRRQLDGNLVKEMITTLFKKGK